MSSARARTHYELLGVSPDCTIDELRAAYRRLARERHPDLAQADGRTLDPAAGTMAEVNEAWRILSDERLRRRYDAVVTLPPSIPMVRQPAPRASRSRRLAWVAGIQAQMARLSRQAGRSAGLSGMDTTDAAGAALAAVERVEEQVESLAKRTEDADVRAEAEKLLDEIEKYKKDIS